MLQTAQRADGRRYPHCPSAPRFATPRGSRLAQGHVRPCWRLASSSGPSGDVWDSAGKETDVHKWVAESHELATSFAYDPAILQAVRSTPFEADLTPVTLDNAYRKAAGEHARRRVVAAGVRLGGLLKE